MSTRSFVSTWKKSTHVNQLGNLQSKYGKLYQDMEKLKCMERAYTDRIVSSCRAVQRLERHKNRCELGIPLFDEVDLSDRNIDYDSNLSMYIQMLCQADDVVVFKDIADPQNDNTDHQSIIRNLEHKIIKNAFIKSNTLRSLFLHQTSEEVDKLRTSLQEICEQLINDGSDKAGIRITERGWMCNVTNISEEKQHLLEEKNKILEQARSELKVLKEDLNDWQQRLAVSKACKSSLYQAGEDKIDFQNMHEFIWDEKLMPQSASNI